MNECAAIGCGRGIRRGYLMCSGHWFKVPLHLRRKLIGFAEQKDTSSIPSLVALQVARREVGLVEGTFAIDEEKRRIALGEWTAARNRLKAELGERYLAEVMPYRRGLRALLDQSGAGDPLEAAGLAIRFDQHQVDRDKNARRMSAAVDLYELALGLQK